MALFKAMRGNRAALDAKEKHDGYAYFCTDDGTFHIDYMDENGELQRKQLNAKDTETLLGATLVNELTNSENQIPTTKAVTNALELKVDKSDLVQSDWDEIDENSLAFIKNKPDLKTILNGVLVKINEKADKTELREKIDRSEISDAIELSAEMGLVSPTVADDGAIYTDENGVLYTL